VARYGYVARLSDIEHLLFLLAEDVPIADLTVLPERVTRCRAYHLTPPGEERVARMWPTYAVGLRDTAHTVHLRASVPDTLGEVTVVEADRATVEAVIASLPQLPPATLVAIALAGGDAEPVADRDGALGDPGTLLLVSPWARADWVSEEVCDHTSLMLLCERWTAERGDEARARIPGWRRRVCGDLVDAIDLGGAPIDDDGATGPDAPEAPDASPAADALARPVPYRASTELLIDGDDATLVLSNVGARRAVHLVVDDGAAVSRHTVPASSASRPARTLVPVSVEDGAYDVAVAGPNGFRRRYAGVVRDPGPRCEVAEDRPTDEDPALVLTIDGVRDGDVVTVESIRAGDPWRREVAVGTTDGLREQPWDADHGWYDVVVTAGAHPGWVREYAGHLEAPHLVARAQPGSDADVDPDVDADADLVLDDLEE
jgi:hypothetical protein